jgi:hypothetical protein
LGAQQVAVTGARSTRRYDVMLSMASVERSAALQRQLYVSLPGSAEGW